MSGKRMSGKGGVGKSFVTASLALGMGERLGGEIGVLDADLRSPTVAAMVGAQGPLEVSSGGVAPAIGRGGVRVVSTDLLLDEGKPLRWREPDVERFVWRGTMETGVLREFLSDVTWGSLALLLVDLPPGADGVADLMTLVPGLTGAILVTIPSEASRRSVARTMRSARDEGIELLGVVENMSGRICPTCGETGPVFEGDAGQLLADEFDVPLLARVPLDPRANPSAVVGDPAGSLVEAVHGVLR